MNFLDVRTVVFSQLVTDSVCLAMLVYFWLQNRKRFHGLSFWAADFALQTAGILLIVLRGWIPDWLSVAPTNVLVMGGALLGYVGLERFLGRKSRLVLNYLFLAALVVVNSYFTFIQPSLAARNLVLSIGLLAISGECVWLLWFRAELVDRRRTWSVGFVFFLFCLVSLARLIVTLVGPRENNNIFQYDTFETLILLAFQVLLILLSFSLVLLVNHFLTAETRLQEEKFSKAFHSASYGITLTQLADGRILEANESFERVTGFPRSEAIGKTTLELGIWVQEEDRRAVVNDLLQGKPVFEREVQLRKKDGQPFDGLFSAGLITVGKQPWMLSNLSDISERKRTEAQLKSQADLLANVNDAIVASDAEFRLTAWNAAAERMYGWKAEEVLGRKGVDILQTAWPDAERDPMLKAIAEQGYFRGEATQARRDGSRFPVDVSSIVLHDESGQISGYVSVNRDISERKAAQEQIDLLAKFPAENPNPVLRLDRDGVVVYANLASQALLADWETELGNPAPRLWRDHVSESLAQGSARTTETECAGRVYSIFIVPVLEAGYVNLYGRDVTEQKQAGQTLRESEARYRSLFENMLNGFALCRMEYQDGRPEDFTYLAVNPAFEKLTGLQDVTGRRVSEVIPGIRQSDPALFEVYGRVALTGQPETIETYVEALRMWFSISVYSPEKEFFVAVFEVITERKQAERALQESEARYRALFENMTEGFYQAELIEDASGQAVDFRFVDVNPAHSKILGLEREQVVGRKASELFPGLEDSWFRAIEKVAHTGKPLYVEGYVQSTDRYFANSYFSPGPGQFASIFTDITERKQAELALNRAMEDLKRSNAELEQFAYVASHDLQEPLRMVSSYVQLLERRYKGQLDRDADEFIDYAVDGASRSQRLINDLLSYSRVGSRGQPFTPVSCEAALAQALENLQVMIETQGGKVTHDPLPQVSGDETQLVQLFQNLVGNAIKFHGRQKPRVTISAKDSGKEWTFSVRDNGIGLDPQYAERIFIIFQRLHGREKYEGTGIGLAICKKIVERHGGHIWVESKPGKGATFLFTLPKSEASNHGISKQ